MSKKIGKLLGLILVFAVVGGICSGDDLSSLEKWQAIEQTDEIIIFFDGLFEAMGVFIEGTEERFTVRRTDEKFDLYAGIDESAVDFIISIEPFQVDRLARFAHTGEIAEEEQYRVMKEMFTPATALLLGNKEISSPLVKWLTQAEDLIHVRLKSIISGEDDVSHTLIYANKQWIVIPGLHGVPERSFELSLADAILFQKTALGTLKSDEAGRWAKFGRWYKQWRRETSSVN